MEQIRYVDAISRDFIESKKQLGGVTDFVHFGRAIFGKQLTLRTLRKRLEKLINLDNHQDFTKEEMLKHFQALNNSEGIEK